MAAKSVIEIPLPPICPQLQDPLVWDAVNDVYIALQKLRDQVGKYTGADFVPEADRLDTYRAGNLNIVQFVCAETITAGQFVSAPGNSLRVATNNVANRHCIGVALESGGELDVIKVMLHQGRVVRSGMTAGTIYWLGTSGNLTSTKPTAGGTFAQAIGYSLNATQFLMNISYQVTAN